MSDLISRQAAISAICNACGKIDCDQVDKCEKLQLSSANCSEFPNNSDTISRQDAVSRRRLLSDLKELITAWEKYPVMAEQIKGVEVAVGYVETIPSVTPEQKKGKWIDAVIPNDNGGLPVQVCDQCNTFFPLAYTGGGHRFCPNCGADMRGEQDNCGRRMEK